MRSLISLVHDTCNHVDNNLKEVLVYIYFGSTVTIDIGILPSDDLTNANTILIVLFIWCISFIPIITLCTRASQ